MGKLILREIANTESQDLERAMRFMNLDTTSKLNELFALIDLSVKLNGGQPLKTPQGKGLILKKVHGHL
jgi:hypothetical protein